MEAPAECRVKPKPFVFLFTWNLFKDTQKIRVRVIKSWLAVSPLSHCFFTQQKSLQPEPGNSLPLTSKACPAVIPDSSKANLGIVLRDGKQEEECKQLKGPFSLESNTACASVVAQRSKLANVFHLRRNPFLQFLSLSCWGIQFSPWRTGCSSFQIYP